MTYVVVGGPADEDIAQAHAHASGLLCELLDFHEQLQWAIVLTAEYETPNKPFLSENEVLKISRVVRVERLVCL